MVGLGGLEPPTSPLSGSFTVLYAQYYVVVGLNLVQSDRNLAQSADSRCPRLGGFRASIGGGIHDQTPEAVERLTAKQVR